MKLYLFFGAFLFTLSGFAQEDTAWKEPSKESQAYHKYRQHLTYPPYSFDKINQLVRKQVVTDSEDNLVMKDKAYEALSPREKFTYIMIHGESYSQNCDAMPPIQDEQTKIFGYLPDVFNEFTWSDRQKKFLTDNRDSVMAWMQECASKNNRIGVNFKTALGLINGKEMIPYVIKTYQIKHRDNDLLTLLMLLMKDNNYAPFISSATYKKLYGDNSNYQDFIVANKANRDLILKRAMDFYNEHKK
ncbi:MAG: hypothetical protein JST17_07670 [Bacteroidetes bacterium]|nr:hypothetical protein [Bacteroidota bacterium]MBS1931602.1 hypothetical protein [Bacteroidota bacterium]